MRQHAPKKPNYFFFWEKGGKAGVGFVPNLLQLIGDPKCIQCGYLLFFQFVTQVLNYKNESYPIFLLKREGLFIIVSPLKINKIY